MRAPSLCAAAFGLAAAAFWATILTDSPASHAAVAPLSAHADRAGPDHCRPSAFAPCPLALLSGKAPP
jgi:hypothetical protein